VEKNGNRRQERDSLGRVADRSIVVKAEEEEKLAEKKWESNTGVRNEERRTRRMTKLREEIGKIRFPTGEGGGRIGGGPCSQKKKGEPTTFIKQANESILPELGEKLADSRGKRRLRASAEARK